MIRYLLLFLASTQAIATNYIVEIADFSCAHCLQAESFNYKIKSELKKNGDEFVFAPVGNSNNNPIIELFYNSIKEDKELENRVRPVLFDLVQNLRIPMSTLDELHDWFSINFSQKNIDSDKILKLLEDDQVSFENVISLMKTRQLVEDLNITQTPTYVIITKDIEMHKVNRPKGMHLKEYVQLVIDTYKGVITNE
jgi:hypothetical protein